MIFRKKNSQSRKIQINNSSYKNSKEKEYMHLHHLRTSNAYEFRYQLVAILKTIASENDINSFINIIHFFRKELINEGYMYIEFLNRIIFGLIVNKKRKINYLALYAPCIFMSQIGDYYTVELLEKILPFYKLYKDKYQRLDQYKERLKERLKNLEKSLENAKLHPMIDIIDTWLN